MSQSSFSDHMPGDDRSPPPTPINPFTGKSCPVCGKLNVDIVVGKDPACSLEYYIDPSKRNHDLLLEWIEQCALCKLVYDLDQHWSERGDSTQDMKYVGYNYRYACGRNGSDPLHLAISVDWDSFLIERMVEIAVHADPLSTSSIARMKHWAARCDSNDDKCKVHETALPTRVLDVSDSQNIRLCETAGRPGVYIALSHCWGLPNKTFLTTHKTIADMKAGFAIEQAPATFRDAISITRFLGIRYLWIDSLCIIQYDTADWSREAARMGSVYANAYMTIAAANAKDDNDGFLRLRSDALTSLRIISSTGSSAQVYLQTQHDGIKVEAYNVKEPLDTRGWALQEQRLSHRSLRFGSTQMSWDCQCFSLNESETDHYNGMHISTELLKPQSTISSPLSYHSWYGMVSSFAGRILTYDTDKLPALSGLATEVAKFQDGTYYAGLWWEDMASGMLWFRGRAAELNKPSEYLAPSWSWASLNGWTLAYEDQPAKITLPDIMFRECHLESKNDDKHGAIKSGWLDLSAPVVRLVQREVPNSWRFDDDGLDMALGFVHLEVPDIGLNDHEDEAERYPFNTIGNIETRGVFDLAHKDRAEILGLFLMFSHQKSDFWRGGGDRISIQTAQKDPLQWSELYGILVEYSKKRIAYKRVGYFKAIHLEEGEALQILEGAEMQDIRLY